MASLKNVRTRISRALAEAQYAQERLLEVRPDRRR